MVAETERKSWEEEEMNELVQAGQQQSGIPTITYTKEQVALIKRVYAVDASDDELALFVYASKRLRLDIMARQIHFSKRAGKPVFIVAIDGYRLNAERTGQYAPGKEPTYSYNDNGAIVSATAYVKKLIGGEWHECAATAFMAEYLPDEKQAWMWKKMPHNQLAKCAEALALRRAFPHELSDTVTEDEMAQVREPEQRPPIQQPTPKAAKPETKEPEKKPEAPNASSPKPGTGLAADEFSFIPQAVTRKEGTGAKGPWIATGAKDELGGWFGTFNADHGAILEDAKENGFRVRGTFKTSGDKNQFRDIITLAVEGEVVK